MLRQPGHNQEEFDSFSYSYLAQESIIGFSSFSSTGTHNKKRAAA